MSIIKAALAAALLALSTPALAYTLYGDVNVTLTPADLPLAQSYAFTAPHTWTLPLARQVQAGQTITINDIGGVSATNTLTLQSAAGDNVVGADAVGNTSLTLDQAFESVTFQSNGITLWSQVSQGAHPAASHITGLAPSASVDTTNATNITSGTLPAARLPNPSATTLGGIESIASVAHNFLIGISTAGVPSQAQPSCSDLSGVAASCSTDTTNASNISSGTLAGARLPNPSSSVLGGVQSVAAVAHNFVTSISTSGVPSLAQPAAADVSGLAASATTDTTNASNISSGTLAGARLPNPSASVLGGVESIAAVAHQFITSISTSGVPALAQPAAGDISGLAASATTDTTNASNISSGTLAGARLPVPSASVLGGVESIVAASHKFITSISTLGVPAQAQPACGDLSDAAASCNTDATNAGNISTGTLAGARLPNPSASVLGGIESIAAVSHKFLSSISTAGVPALAQPACGDLSDSVASCNTDATNAANISSGTLPAGRMPAHTGDVTTSAGAVATTIAANAVTNAKAAQMAANTIKGNNTGSTANAADLTVSQTNTLLGVNAGAFTAYTPTVASVAGTITTSTVNSARYWQQGKLVVGVVDVTINSAGTGASGVTVTMPFTSVGGNAGLDSGIETAIGGWTIGGQVTGSKAYIYKYDGTHPGASGARLVIKFTYEAS